MDNNNNQCWKQVEGDCQATDKGLHEASFTIFAFS